MKQHVQRICCAADSFQLDEDGSVGWVGLILITSIVSLGMIVGLSTYRSHVLQQFGDAAVAVRSLRQSYSYEVQIDVNRNGVFGDGEDCLLQADFADTVDLFDTPDNPPACMNLVAAPEDES